jgi:hypothetical protein
MKKKFVLNLVMAAVLTGCVHTWRTETTTGVRETYRSVTNLDGSIRFVLETRTVLTDLDKGGAVTLLSDPKAAQIAVRHTNQDGLGGGSALYMGGVGWTTSSNAGQVVDAVGGAAGTIIGDAVKAVAK